MIMSGAVLRMTKLCAPKCLDFNQMSFSKQEKSCLDQCVRQMHGVNETTLKFFIEFEKDAKTKQHDLVLDIEREQRHEQAKKVRQERKIERKTQGLERM